MQGQESVGVAGNEGYRKDEEGCICVIVEIRLGTEVEIQTDGLLVAEAGLGGVIGSVYTECSGTDPERELISIGNTIVTLIYN